MFFPLWAMLSSSLKEQGDSSSVMQKDFSDYVTHSMSNLKTESVYNPIPIKAMKTYTSTVK